jgi:hypothetical protein
LGILPGGGGPDKGEIWLLGLVAVVLLLLWPELRVEVVATTSPNNVVAVSCFSNCADPVSLLLPVSARGGEGRESRVPEDGGSGSS